MRLAKEDFYCGAFLSLLLNNGIDPALFDKRDDANRKIYDFDTNKGSFRVYVKSSEAPASVNEQQNSSLWNFPFTEKQIDELKEIGNESRQLFFIFICGQKKLNESRIAITPSAIVFKCIDLSRENKYKRQDIKFRLTKGSWHFEIYSSGNESIKVRYNDIYEVFGGRNN